MTGIAYLFPGQGSQLLGMGHDFAQTYPAARAVFQRADEASGMFLSRMMFEGPAAELDATANTQPALYVCSAAMLAALRAERPDLQPAYLAGHSLGELTALFAAGAMSFEDGLELVRERGRLMAQAGESHPGAMAALLGIDIGDVRQICQQASDAAGQPVVVANDNCPGQAVISGATPAVEQAMALALDRGAKKAVRLAVSVAAHSPLMQPAADVFAGLVARPFTVPATPVIGNVSAAPLDTQESIQSELAAQLTSPVRWTESVRVMIAGGADYFVEIGSGDVLTGLMKRIDRKVARHAVNDVASMRAFLAGLDA